MMNMETAHCFVLESLGDELRETVMHLADDDSVRMMDFHMEVCAGAFRDLELTLDLTGNLDAPL